MMQSFCLRAKAILAILLTRKFSMPELLVTVPQTDTGGLVEYTKGDGLFLVKEFGKLLP